MYAERACHKTIPCAYPVGASVRRGSYRSWLVAGAAMLALCGTTLATANTATPAPTAITPVDTTPPVIGGVVPGIAVVGQPFSFQPSASDTNGATLTFTITSQPAWTSFDPTTGRVYGTPKAGDVGPSA